MLAHANLSSAEEVLSFRARQREELNCQIVHDSIHRREGWTRTYLLSVGAAAVGFGSVAIAGPWQGKPTLFEFYVLPGYRQRAFECFEALLRAGQAEYLEIQTNDPLTTVMALHYGESLTSAKIVFRDGETTQLHVPGTVLRQVTPDVELRRAMERCRGGGQWVLDIDGEPRAQGGVLFHYNPPYGDIYLEVAEGHRERGLGAYFVQELKSACYKLGALPCARCSPENVASRRTMQRAGFVPVAHILVGAVRSLES